MGIKKNQNKGKLSKQWKILIILVAIVLVIFGYFKMFSFVMLGYIIVTFFDFNRIKKIPYDQALKNVE